MSRETDAILAKLRRWCDKERGRRSAFARQIDVPAQQVTDWFAGRKTPTWEQGLRIQGFLDQRPRKKK